MPKKKPLTDAELSNLDELLNQVGSHHRSESSFLDQPPCPEEENVWRFLSREMEEEEREKFIEHMVRCDSCRAIVAEGGRKRP